jgi:hypothetical protein
MKRTLLPLLLLAACAQPDLWPGPDNAALAPPEGMLHPAPRPGSGATLPPEGAVTAEAFDTTSAEARAAAVAATPAAERSLGRSVATLGNPADPGFWLETPLVQAVTPGRVVSVESGKSVQLELRPIEGQASAGSRISLAALRLLEVGLTGLHELEIFAR